MDAHCQPSLPPATHFHRVLPPDAPRQKYHPHPTRALHWGQLKLLASEIEFLTPHAHTPKVIVVYAGAAPGHHIPRLASMFPQMRFVLVDPLPVIPLLESNPQIEILQMPMTCEVATRLRTEHQCRPLLFISDVRVGPPPDFRESHDQHQRRIMRDMLAQQHWHMVLKPVQSMLKFRLPWSIRPRSLYLAGAIHLPVHGRPHTHETRLITAPGEPRLVWYDHAEYEEKMAHFNAITRVSPHGPKQRCYDCTALHHILSNYLTTQPTMDPDSTQDLCDEIKTSLQH